MTEFPTDDQIDDLWDYHAGYYQLYEEVRGTVHDAFKRWGIPEPTALEDGEPQPFDLDDEGCCWWWDEMSKCLTLWKGDSSAIELITEHKKFGLKFESVHYYTHWLPHWAIKEPKEKNDTCI